VKSKSQPECSSALTIKPKPQEMLRGDAKKEKKEIFVQKRQQKYEEKEIRFELKPPEQKVLFIRV